MGHLHDGGTHLTYDNGGQQFCDTRASYGTTPDYVDPPGGMAGMDHGDGMDHGGGATHISEMTKCPTGSSLRSGDVLRLTGYYDDAVHNEMSHNGRLHPVMALGLLYYAQ